MSESVELGMEQQLLTSPHPQGRVEWDPRLGVSSSQLNSAGVLAGSLLLLVALLALFR